MRIKPIVLEDGRLSQIQSGDALDVDSFSYKKVKNGESVVVPEDQQMLLSGSFTNFGQFSNFGEVVLIDLEDSDTPIPPFPDLPPDNFSHFKISSGEEKTIPQNQQMNVFGSLTNLGMIKNFGEINVTKIFQEDQEDPVVLPGDNFSHKEILSGEQKTIPTRQQMIVSGIFKNFGQMNLFGEMALINPTPNDGDDEYLPPFQIDSGETFNIKKNRLMFIPRMFVNFGQLNNFGELALGGL